MRGCRPDPFRLATDDLVACLGGRTFVDLYESLFDWLLRVRNGLSLPDLMDRPVWELRAMLDVIRGHEREVRAWLKAHPNGE